MNKQEENVVVMATEELINEIGGTLPEDIVYLSDHVAPTELIPLNPVVVKYNEILEKAFIMYDPDNEKESVQAFKDAKGEIRSFRAEVKRTKSKMKKDILESGRAMDRIEKLFVDGATEVEEKLMANFKVYLDEQERIKEEKEKAKNKAIQDEIDKLESEKNEAIEKMAIQNAYNNIYYETIMNYATDVDAFITNAGKPALTSFFENLKHKKAFTIVKEKAKENDWNRLTAEQVLSCNNKFEQIKDNIFLRIHEKIKSIDVDQKKVIEEQVQEKLKEEKAVDFSNYETACNTVSFQLATLRTSLEFIISDIPRPDESTNSLMNAKKHLDMAQNLIDNLRK